MKLSVVVSYNEGVSGGLTLRTAGDDTKIGENICEMIEKYVLVCS